MALREQGISTLLVHNTNHKTQDQQEVLVIKLQNTLEHLLTLTSACLASRELSCHLLHTDLRRRLGQTLLNLLFSYDSWPPCKKTFNLYQQEQ